MSLRMPSHCLKKNATPAARHCLRIDVTHSHFIGRARGPDSPPTIAQSIPRSGRRSRGPTSGSSDKKRTAAGTERSPYRFGNRSALEWILDQYKESKPKDPTIRERFDTYRFADYKEKVIDLLARVTTVSVETQRIVEEMTKASR